MDLPTVLGASLVIQMVKNVPAIQEIWIPSLCQEDPLEKGMATHSSILAWRIPWTEESGGLQSTGLQRAGHDWATNTHTYLPEKDTIIVIRDGSKSVRILCLCVMGREWDYVHLYKRKWKVNVLVAQSCLTLCDPMDWNSPNKNTGVGCHSLLQGIFLTQVLHSSLLNLLHYRQILYHLSHQEVQYHYRKWKW